MSVFGRGFDCARRAAAMKAQSQGFALRQRARIAHDLPGLAGDQTVAAREDIAWIEVRQIAGDPVEQLIALQQSRVRRPLQAGAEHGKLVLPTAEADGKPWQARIAQLQLGHATFVQPFPAT